MTVLLKPKQGGRPILLDKPVMLIGRHPECDALIEVSQKISRKHCFVAVADNRCYVHDLESMNGVWVNGRRVTECTRLQIGDELMIGDVPFELVRNGVKPRPEAPSRQNSAQDSGTISPTGAPPKDADNTLEEAEGQAAIQFDEPFSFPSESPEESGEDFMIPIAELDE